MSGDANLGIVLSDFGSSLPLRQDDPPRWDFSHKREDPSWYDPYKLPPIMQDVQKGNYGKIVRYLDENAKECQSQDPNDSRNLKPNPANSLEPATEDNQSGIHPPDAGDHPPVLYHSGLTTLDFKSKGPYNATLEDRCESSTVSHHTYASSFYHDEPLPHCAVSQSSHCVFVTPSD